MAKKRLELKHRRVACSRCGAVRDTMTFKGSVLDAACSRCRHALDVRRAPPAEVVVKKSKATNN